MSVAVTSLIFLVGGALTHDGLREACIDAMADALAFARRHLLGGDEKIIADDEHSSHFQYRKTLDLLKLLEEDFGPTAEDLARHIGKPPIPADRQTHIVIQGSLKQAFPHCHVVGEEATGDEWRAAQDARPGSLIFSVDAIDGSLLYDTFTFGYSCNLLAYERGDIKDRLLLAAVANSSGFVACYERDQPGALIGNLFDPRARRIRPVTEPIAREDFRQDTVAAVAATPKQRRTISRLLDDDGLTVSTLGGAPAALGVVIGRLSAMVCPVAQTTFDTAYLPILGALNITVLTVENEPLALGLTSILGFFDHLAGDGAGWNAQSGVTRPVPAFIAARDPRFAGKLQRLLVGA